MQRSFDVIKTAPLAGLHGVVYGAGPIGLFTAFALIRNGATVELLSADPIEQGVGFVNAAGLIEPVASSDPRAAKFLMSALDFCAWAQPDPAWGIEPRRVLFLSDNEAKVRQDWMLQLPGYRRATADELVGGRPYGSWFETYVLQPNIAIDAVHRELRALGIQGPKGAKVTSAAKAGKAAATSGGDFFVLALGLGLAEIKDIERVAGVNAMLSAGVGVTVVMRAEHVNLDHVIMDDVDLGYLIPQRTQVVGGGTNIFYAHDDDEARAAQPDPELVKHVRKKISRLFPDAADLPGEEKVGSRPLRAGGQVLTATLEPPEVPIFGLVLGGAGGSGWTFAVGVADAAAREVGQRFERDGVVPLVPRGDDEGIGRTAALENE